MLVDARYSSIFSPFMIMHPLPSKSQDLETFLPGSSSPRDEIYNKTEDTFAPASPSLHPIPVTSVLS